MLQLRESRYRYVSVDTGVLMVLCCTYRYGTVCSTVLLVFVRTTCTTGTGIVQFGKPPSGFARFAAGPAALLTTRTIFDNGSCCYLPLVLLFRLVDPHWHCCCGARQRGEEAGHWGMLLRRALLGLHYLMQLMQ